MKRFAAILFMVLLVGCSSFKSRTYDPVEYYQITNLTVQASQALGFCEDGDADLLEPLTTSSAHLSEFLYNKPDSRVQYQVARQLQMQVRELATIDSTRYCIHSLGNIHAGYRALSVGVANGNKDLCDEGIPSRAALFERSYKANTITKQQYASLVEDLDTTRLAYSSGCTLQVRYEIEQSLELAKAALSLL